MSTLEQPKTGANEQNTQITNLLIQLSPEKLRVVAEQALELVLASDLHNNGYDLLKQIKNETQLPPTQPRSE